MVLLDTGTPGTSREIYSEDADDGTRTRNPSVVNHNDAIHQLDKLNSFPAIAFELFSSMARALGLQPRSCEFVSHHRHEFASWNGI